MEAVRRKSPRAPSISLGEALERAGAAYDRERLHPAPTEIVAQNMGYKSSNSGTALSAIASLRYYGLLERPQEGKLAVAKPFEDYRFSPDEDHRRELLIRFLRTPSLFSELLDRYESGLPSDATLRYELIQRGFLPAAAEACVAVFRKSVELADYFRRSPVPSYAAEQQSEDLASAMSAPDPELDDLSKIEGSNRITQAKHSLSPTASPQHLALSSMQALPASLVAGEADFIPVRLSGGRRAWLVVPMELYEADKARIKAQIDLLLTVEQESDQ